MEAGDENTDPNRPPSKRLRCGELRKTDASSDWTVVYSDSNSSIVSELDSSSTSSLDQAGEERKAKENEAFIRSAAIGAAYFAAQDAGLDRVPQDLVDKYYRQISDDFSRKRLAEEEIEGEKSEPDAKQSGQLEEGEGVEDDPPPPPPSFADHEADSEASDIAIISEDEMETSAVFNDQESLLSASQISIISENSNFSVIREKYLESQRPSYLMRRRSFLNKDVPSEFVGSDEDSVSQIDTYQVHLDKNHRIRAYFHQPNTVLNGKLNLILILTITAVVGLGIGHFIGWSNVYSRQQQLSLGQVIKLKQLQDDLLMCMKEQASSTVFGKQESKVCLHDSDYWKQRFKTLFNENKSLIGLLQKTQRHFHEKGNHENVLAENECVNKTTSDEFHSLKLDLLVKQMEHLQLLEVLEVVKSKGKENQKRVQVLEEENEDLKKKLEEEEEDDQEIVQTWGQRVALLQSENEELRKSIEVDDQQDEIVIGELRDRIARLSGQNRELRDILEQLESQVSGGNVASLAENGSLDRDVIVTRHSLIRQRINQLMTENEELKSNIALYRWTKPTASGQSEEDPSFFDASYLEDQQQEEDFNQRLIETLHTKLKVLHRQLLFEQKESNHWKNKFESLVRKLRKTEDKLDRQKLRHNKRRQAQSGEDFLEDEPVIRESLEKRKQTKQEKGKTEGEGEYDSLYDSLKDSLKSSFKLSKKYCKALLKKVKHNFDQSKQKLKKLDLESGNRILDMGKQWVYNMKDNLVKNNQELFHYISDNMANLAHTVEEKFKVNLHKLNGHFNSKTEAEKPDYSHDDWVMSRAKAREEARHMQNAEQQEQVDDWLIERARAREQYRKQQSQDNLDDPVDAH